MSDSTSRTNEVSNIECLNTKKDDSTSNNNNNGTNNNNNNNNNNDNDAHLQQFTDSLTNSAANHSDSHHYGMSNDAVEAAVMRYVGSDYNQWTTEFLNDELTATAVAAAAAAAAADVGVESQHYQNSANNNSNSLKRFKVTSFADAKKRKKNPRADAANSSSSTITSDGPSTATINNQKQSKASKLLSKKLQQPSNLLRHDDELSQLDNNSTEHDELVRAAINDATKLAQLGNFDHIYISPDQQNNAQNNMNVKQTQSPQHIGSPSQENNDALSDGNNSTSKIGETLNSLTCHGQSGDHDVSKHSYFLDQQNNDNVDNLLKEQDRKSQLQQAANKTPENKQDIMSNISPAENDSSSIQKDITESSAPHAILTRIQDVSLPENSNENKKAEAIADSTTVLTSTNHIKNKVEDIIKEDIGDKNRNQSLSYANYNAAAAAAATIAKGIAAAAAAATNNKNITNDSSAFNNEDKDSINNEFAMGSHLRHDIDADVAVAPLHTHLNIITTETKVVDDNKINHILEKSADHASKLAGNSPAGKMFSKEEHKSISSFIDEYCKLMSMTREDICKRIWSNSRVKDNFWELLQRVLPARSRASIYKHVRRAYHIFEVRGKWTPEDDTKLALLSKDKEGQWKQIGEIMGRMPEDCRDRWRNYIKCGANRARNKWSNEEESLMLNIVHQLYGEEPSGSINWTDISERIGGVRSRIQCRYKWNKIIKRRQKSINTSNAVTSSENFADSVDYKKKNDAEIKKNNSKSKVSRIKKTRAKSKPMMKNVDAAIAATAAATAAAAAAAAFSKSVNIEGKAVSEISDSMISKLTKSADLKTIDEKSEAHPEHNTTSNVESTSSFPSIYSKENDSN